MAIVTVSRTHGSGGTQYAREVAKRLGYVCYGSEMLKNTNQCARDHFYGLSAAEPEAPSLFDRFEELMSNRNFYKTILHACVYDLALGDNVVFTGMGTQVMLSDIPNAFHVRVVRLLSDRVRAISRVRNVSADDALSLVEKMDHGKREFMSHYFDTDPADPTLYNLTINCSRVPLEYAVDAAEAYATRYIAPGSAEEAKAVLNRRLLEKRAETMLFKLDMVHDYGKVTFEAREEGVLAVRGVVGGDHAKKKLFEALEGLRNVQKIEDHVKVGILSHILY